MKLVCLNSYEAYLRFLPRPSMLPNGAPVSASINSQISTFAMPSPKVNKQVVVQALRHDMP